MDALCLFKLEDDEMMPKVYAAVIKVISCGVSIMFLSTHLIVFSITEEMWTTMGKNLAAFCLSLLLGLSTFIGEHIASYFVATVLTYYFSLTHSTWLLCMSFELWRSLGKTKSRRDYESQHSFRFLWYSLFSWLEPVLFVAVALYAEFWDNNPFPEYLKPNFESASSHTSTNSAFLLFFGFPFCVHLILNFVFMSCALGLEMKRKDLLIDGEMGDEFKLYSRLNLLIVFTWMLNLVDILVVKNEVLTILFVVLNAIQALYIFLVFTFNNKISSLVYENNDFDLHTLLKSDDESATEKDEQLVPSLAVITYI